MIYNVKIGWNTYIGTSEKSRKKNQQQSSLVHGRCSLSKAGSVQGINFIYYLYVREQELALR